MEAEMNRIGTTMVAIAALAASGEKIKQGQKGGS
jgi:hypothetical protein